MVFTKESEKQLICGVKVLNYPEYSPVLTETETELGTAFFSILNVPFFSVLLKNVTFFLATYETQKNDAFFSVLF